jgi:hypothetical protein
MCEGVHALVTRTFTRRRESCEMRVNLGPASHQIEPAGRVRSSARILGVRGSLDVQANLLVRMTRLGLFA